MASWSEQVRRAREGTGLTRRALATLAGISEDALFSYEAGRRRPTRERLLALTRAMRLDGATTNAILEAAGMEPDPSPWLRQGAIVHRPLAALHTELEGYTWPCLALNERFEIVAWNAPAVRVAELDFARALPQLHQRNLLRIAAMRHFRARVTNWRDVVAVMAGMYKNHHMGREDLGEGSAHFRAVVDDILATDADALPALLDLWQNTKPSPQRVRIVFPVDWRTSDDTPLRFNCIIAGWSEFDGIGVHDWHPADATTWAWLGQA